MRIKRKVLDQLIAKGFVVVGAKSPQNTNLPAKLNTFLPSEALDWKRRLTDLGYNGPRYIVRDRPRPEESEMKIISMPPAPGANAVSRCIAANRRQSDVRLPATVQISTLRRVQ